MSFLDDDWQEMPVVREAAPSSSTSSSDEDNIGRRGYGTAGGAGPSSLGKKKLGHARKKSAHMSSAGASKAMQGNATGVHLDIDDARGYSWREAPSNKESAAGLGNDEKGEPHKGQSKDKRAKGRAKGAESDSSEEETSEDEGASRGYTQLRLEDDVEGDELHAATDYLFGGGSGAGANKEADDGLYEPTGGTGATPLSQLATTKKLLTEGQKIAYVGLVSLVARDMIRKLERVPGKETQPAAASADEWRLRVMARLYQHMDIEADEQSMIESLAQHGVLASDMAPSLITTSKVDNPDFDPEAKAERDAEEERQRLKKEALELDRLAREAEEQQAQLRRSLADESAASEHYSSHGTLELGPAEEPGIGLSSDLEVRGNGSSTSLKSVSPFDPAHASPADDEGDLSRALGQDEGDLGDMDYSSGDSLSRKEADKAASALSQAPPPPYKRFELAEDADDEGDIGAALETPVQRGGELPSPSKTPQASLRPLQPEDVDHEPESGALDAHQVADPNTKAQLVEADAQSARATGELGLTAAPQAIETMPSALEGVTEELSSADEHITLDLRWTVLCDLFLVLTADSVYDARSRVLLETVAAYLSLTWMDVTKFEKRVTDALEIEEGVSGSLKSKKAIKKRAELARRRRLVMMGLATVGGGLIIGFSAGMLAPVIGAGLGAALGTIGVGGTTGFLGGVGGAAVITGTATAGGMAIGGRGMSRRTRTVRTFEFKPVHNNKRVNCYICVGGFMNGAQDDPRLPFSVIDSVMGDVFAVLWEPDMMKEMGDAIYLLYTETVVQGLQQVLAATIAGGLVGALAAPLWLTKLGLLIDNPWSNALDRSWSAGLILADVLAKRAMGVRPVTLVGFSLGARSIFYALTELAKNKKFGVVQDVFIIGAPVTASDAQWKEARSVVSGRFVNAFSRTDWILGYLFRATTGGIRSIAGLHPVERVPDVENVDVTTTVPGHLQYRAFMPLVLDELGFKTTADYFDEPEDLNNVPDREVLREALQIQQEEEQTRKVQNSSGGFGRIFKRKKDGQAGVGNASTDSSQSSTPAQRSSTGPTTTNEYEYDDDDLPPRELEREPAVATPSIEPTAETADAGNSALAVAPKHLAVDTVRRSSDLASTRSATPEAEKPPNLAVHFDTEAMLAELRSSGIEVRELESSLPPLVASEQARRSDPTPTPTLASAPPKQLKTPMIATTRDDARRQAEPSNQAASQALAADLPRRPSATPTPYAHSFSESPFSRLPPPAPPAMMTEDSMGGVSLSFADSYSDEEDEPAPPVPAPGQAAPVSLDAARGYGLSSDAARELARRFNEPDSRASHEESGRGSSLEGRAASYLPAEDGGWGGDSSRQGRDDEGDVASNSRSDDLPRPSSSKDLPVAPDGTSPWSTPASHNPFAFNDEGRDSSGDIAFSSSTPRGPSAIRQETLAEPPRSLSFDRLAIDDSSNYMPEGLQVRQPASRNTSSSAWETDNPWG
ncbi:DUF726-domain-containing protein [Ceraceosorus guamensis]|uniref:DUF726-domain-containing protein n=1 Tax=Ceraceosorus guamensis TaxID=1522189 RepID=A0A316W031_9BASI|nr:DUF726-domain-containing protein [Ceraceosorus guamensis]PWN43196.1 DUF726-domain-containing protein [Ceraceosorus guamensis]